MVLIVGSIVFPVLIIITRVHQNSVFDLVEGFSEINTSRGKAENATSNVIKEAAQNVSAPASEGEDQNITRSDVGKAIVYNILILLDHISLIYSRLLCLMSSIFELFNF